jgi:hypothetical protein
MLRKLDNVEEVLEDLRWRVQEIHTEHEQNKLAKHVERYKSSSGSRSISDSSEAGWNNGEADS